MFVDSPLHGFLQLLVLAAIVVLARRARVLVRRRAAQTADAAEQVLWMSAPLGEPVEIRPGKWMVRVTEYRSVFGLSREQALERAGQPWPSVVSA